MKAKESTIKITRVPYYLSIISFVVFLALLLLTIIDVRRGFLFSPAGYLIIGTPAAILRFNLAQLPMVLAGGAGVWLSHKIMRKWEQKSAIQTLNLKKATVVFAIIILLLLILDMFTFRSIGAIRALERGVVPQGAGSFGHVFVIPVDRIPGWLQPFGEGVNHVLFTWHSLIIGIFVGSLFLVTANSGLIARMQGNGLGAHLIGAALALPTPFSALVAAPIGSILYQRGASLGPVLAFSLAAPTLNITSLILAAALLPPEYAIFRVISGVVVSVFLTYFVSLIAFRWTSEKDEKFKSSFVVDIAKRINSAFNRIFQFNRFIITEIPESPSDLIISWLKMSWKLAGVILPVFLITAPLTVYLVDLMPATANNLWGVIVISFFGTIIMSPAWTEIAFAREMLANGFPALAATSLIVLPAVSIPSLLIIAGAMGKMKIAILTGLAIFLTGIVAGIIFLR